MNPPRLQDLPLKGARVLMRVDFNVPLDERGGITDDTRIRESLASIQYLLAHGASVILMSHLGRPQCGDGCREPKNSLAPCAQALSRLLQIPVQLAPDCVGPEVERMAKALTPGSVLLLENLRFHHAEEHPDSDPSFAQRLASLADLYVNDAFGTAHRAHSSTVAVARCFSGRCGAGLLMQKEIHALSSILLAPERPFFAVVGGAKVSSKIGVLKSLVAKADAIFIGGAMAFTFFKAWGLEVGASPYEPAHLGMATELCQMCAHRGLPLYLPEDLVIAEQFHKDAPCKVVSMQEGIAPGWHGMDIGPATIRSWEGRLKGARSIFWNGPVGVCEMPRFAVGTEQLARCLAQLSAMTVVGGGDSVAAINALHLAERFSHVSTGGGAALEFIEYGHLPGVDALQ